MIGLCVMVLVTVLVLLVRPVDGRRGDAEAVTRGQRRSWP